MAGSSADTPLCSHAPVPLFSGEKHSKSALPVADIQPYFLSSNLNENCCPAVVVQVYAVHFFYLFASLFPATVIDAYLATPGKLNPLVEVFVIFRDLVFSAASHNKSEERTKENTALLELFQLRLSGLETFLGVKVEHDDLNKLLGFVAFLCCYAYSILVTKRPPKDSRVFLDSTHCLVCQGLLTPLAMCCPHGWMFTGGTYAAPVVPTLLALPVSHRASVGRQSMPQQFDFEMNDSPSRVIFLLNHLFTPPDLYLLQVAEIGQWGSMFAALAFEVRARGTTASGASPTLELSGISRLLEDFQASDVVKCSCKSDMSQLMSIDPTEATGNHCVLLSFTVSRIFKRVLS